MNEQPDFYKKNIKREKSPPSIVKTSISRESPKCSNWEKEKEEEEEGEQEQEEKGAGVEERAKVQKGALSSSERARRNNIRGVRDDIVNARWDAVQTRVEERQLGKMENWWSKQKLIGR